jgi:prefoldin subunit 5
VVQFHDVISRLGGEAMQQRKCSFSVAVRTFAHVMWCGVLLLALTQSAAAAPVNREPAQARLELRRSIDRVTQANLALATSMTKLSQTATDFTKGLAARGGQSASQSVEGVNRSASAASVNSGSELAMISIQQLVSQRQQAVQQVTQMLQSLGDVAKAVAKNIGDGGGKSGPCKTCAAFVREISSSDRADKLRAVKDAMAQMKSAALEASRAGTQPSAFDPKAVNAKAVNAMSADAVVALIVAADAKAHVTDLQDAFTRMRAAQNDSYRASIGTMVSALQATVAAGHLVTGTGGATEHLFATIDQLKQQLDELTRQIAALEAQWAALEAKMADLFDQITKAEADCDAAIQQWVAAVEAVANAGGQVVAGAVVGFVVGGPIGAVVGAAAGAAGGVEAAEEQALVAVGLFCNLLSQLLHQEADLSKQMSAINAKIGALKQQVDAVNQQIANNQNEIDRSQTTLRNAQPRANLVKGSAPSKGGVVRSSNSSSASGVVATSKGGSSPCGSAANPCNQPRNRLMGPGLLDGGGGFATQGPAATGNAIAPTAPTTTYNRIR